jgi:hypothetical protein
MAYTAQQIVQMVNTGAGPADMYSGSDIARKMADLHQQIADKVLKLQGGMGEHWQGDAAAQAYVGAGPLVQASQVSKAHLDQAQNLYMGQGSSFKDLQSKVAAVGNLGDKPSDDWVSSTPLSFLTNRSDEISAYNQKAQQVVDGYGVYHGQSEDNSSRWPQQSHYGELGLPPGGSDVTVTPAGGGPGTAVSHVVSGHNGSNSGNSGGAFVNHGGGSGSPVNGGNQGGGPGGGASQHSVPPPVGGPAPIHSGSSGNNGTSTSGYVPPPSPNTGGPGSNYPGGPGSYGSGGFGPGSGGAGSSDFGPGAGGFGPGSGFSAGGGYSSGGSGGYSSGAGGSGSGSGSGSGGLGAGKGSGAGAMGDEAGSGPRGGSTAGSNSPGRPGSPGAGGMGHGGKGEKEEDAEHRRPAYLLETDPDNALIGELPRVSPPVIGL